MSSPTAVWADAAFGPVRREPIVLDEPRPRDELPPPTAPLHRYVSLFNEQAGFTVFSDGLAEYEARDDGSMLVTLVRGVGELSRNDLPERPGHAGWPTPTPGAQCLGRIRRRVCRHAARSARSGQRSMPSSARLTTFSIRSSGRRYARRSSVQPRVDGVELVGAGLASRRSRRARTVSGSCLRCVNLLDEEVDGAWRLPFEIREARLGEARRNCARATRPRVDTRYRSRLRRARS